MSFRAIKKYVWLLTVVTASYQISASQTCTLPSKIFLPLKDTVSTTGYGTAIDTDNGYLVAGALYHDSLQVYAGLAFIYKLTANNQWQRIATLAPSNPGKYTEFGTKVSISGTHIAIQATIYSDIGDHANQIYIFEKPNSGEWTSTTESYILSNPGGFDNTQLEFEINGDELITAIINIQSVDIKVYKFLNGVLALQQSLDGPEQASMYAHDWNLATGDNFFALGDGQTPNADGSYGAVFIYEKSGTYPTTPVKVTSAGPPLGDFVGFAHEITASHNTLFILGYTDKQGVPLQTLYVTERPVNGWTSTTLSPIAEWPGYTSLAYQLAANDQFVFVANASFTSINGIHKNPAGWSAPPTQFAITNLPSTTSIIGQQIQINGDHLVVGCPSRLVSVGAQMGKDFITDFYAPQQAWDQPNLPINQWLHIDWKSAIDDYFGISMDASATVLAVGASQDSKKGIYNGSVYLFDLTQTNASGQKIYSPELENYAGFGYSVAIEDSILLVTAPLKDSIAANGQTVFHNMGKTFAFRQTTHEWQYHSQLENPNPHSEASFGQHVAYHKGYAAVSEFANGTSETVGRVHLYKKDNAGYFHYLGTLQPAVEQRHCLFGSCILVSDSLIVVGSGGNAVGQDFQRQVYLYKKKGEWTSATEDARLTATDPGFGDLFGISVSMYNDYIVVGAPRSPGFDFSPFPRNYLITGAAYLYKKPAGGWKGTLYEMAKFTPRSPYDLENFGYSVAIDHNDIFIGAPGEFYRYNYSDHLTNTTNRFQPGKVFHYVKPANAEWTSNLPEKNIINPFEPEFLDGYGNNLLIKERNLLVSALLDDNASGFRAGSVQTLMQLPAIDSVNIQCSTTAPIKLSAFPKGGTWLVDGQPSSGTFNPALAGPGTHTLTYSVNGCTTQSAVKVVPDNYQVISKSPSSLLKCLGQSVPLQLNTNSNASTYRWYYKSTSSQSFQKIDSLKMQIQAAKPGYYEARISRGICPLVKEDFAVQDEPKVTLHLDAVLPVCAEVEQPLTATPAGGTWTGRGISAQGLFTSAGTADGNYSERYTLVTPAGCTYKDSLVVQIDRLKEPDLLFNNEKVCGSQPVTLRLSNVDNRSAVQWFSGLLQEIPGQNSTQLTVNQAGDYSASVTKYGCTKKTRTVNVQAAIDSVFVPNVITPNGDNQNDYFQIRSSGFDEMTLSVFNRYGNTLFETNDPQFQWPAPNVSTGIYYWHLKYLTCGGQVKEHKGWLQVVR
jgi:gliding motility-associated-like protein